MKILFRTICLLVGILIIITVAPHRNPWTMSNVQSKLVDKVTKLQVNVVPFNWKIQVPLNTLIITVCLVLAGLIVSSRSTRTATMEFVQRRKSFLILMLFFLWLSWAKILWTFILLAAGFILVGISYLIKKFNLFFHDLYIFLIRMLIISIFILTLKPSSRGLPVFLYLTLGTLGVILILIGGYPFVRLFGKINRLKVSILKLAQGLFRVFFTVPKPVFMLLIFLIAFILTNLGSYFLFDHMPHVTDCVVQLFHGKIFATGHLVAKVPELPEFFDFNPLMIMREGKWYSVYPPGHSFLMMLGTLFDAPWLINPLLGALTVLLIYLLGKEIYDEKTGRLSALLGILSPFLIIMSSGFMNHTSSLFYAMLFMLFFAKTFHSAKFRYPLISGFGLGMMVNIRPYTALSIAAPFCIYSFWLLWKDFRLNITKLLIIALVTMIFIGILFGYNYATNGSPTLFGYVVQFGKRHNPGFKDVGGRYYHSPKKGWVETLNRLNFLNVRLFEFPIPSLLFIFALFISGTKNRWNYILFGVFFFLLFSHFFYWYSVGNNLIPRFLYESSPALIILSARGILRCPRLICKKLKIPTTEKTVKAVIFSSLVLCLIIVGRYYIPSTLNYYQNDFYTHIKKNIIETVEKKDIKNAIVFVKSDFYRSAFPANSPTLDGDVIYAIDRGEQNKLLMEYFPNREYYRADGKIIEKIQK